MMKKVTYLITVLFALALMSISCENEEPEIEQEKTQPEYLYSNGGIWEGFIKYEEPAQQYFKIVFKRDGEFRITRKSTNEWGTTSTISDGRYESWYVVKDVDEEDRYELYYNNGTVVVFEGERTDYHKSDIKPFLRLSDDSYIWDYYSSGTDIEMNKLNQ